MHRPIVAALVAALISACAAAASPAATHGSIRPTLRALQHLEHRAPLVTLRHEARIARLALAHGRPCVAVAALNRFIAVTKRRHRADMGARRLQLVALKRAGHRACGLSKPVVRIDRRLRPAVSKLADGRPVARTGDADFVADELLVTTADHAALEHFVARWHGHVMRTMAHHGVKPTYLVRVGTTGASVGGLSDDLRRIDPAARGTLEVSSARGLRLLAIAADAAAGGLDVGLDWLDHSAQFEDRVAAEAGSGPGGWDPNPWAWSMFNGAGQNIGVGDAWRALELSGKLGNRVRIGIIDGGFAPNADFPASTTGATGVKNNFKCSGGTKCPWHGTSTALTAAGVADNGVGAAGVAGPIGDLDLIQQGSDTADHIDAIFEAIDDGDRVINISSDQKLPALATLGFAGYTNATEEARDEGVLIFASAGNDGVDVDAEDCAIACWEETWYAPCENAGVTCVGGIQEGGTWRHAKSNYGYESCESAQCDVDIYAPFTVWTGTDPDTPVVRKVSGTSFSSPFAAGVAALEWAANPSLSAGQVEAIMQQTAHWSPDPKVHSYVWAFGAVLKALGGTNHDPTVEITSPANGTHVGYGGLNLVTFTALGGDIEDVTCCAVEWTSDVEGDLGTGPSVTTAFMTPGLRIIKATVHDSHGDVGQSTIVVWVGNSAPVAKIVSPVADSQPYQGLTYKLHGTVSDTNEPLIGCGALKWKIGAASLTGCQPQFAFGTLGDATIELTATDSDGATDKTSVKVHVVKQPLNSPPHPTILTPDDNQALDPGKTYALTSKIDEPDGDAVTLQWTMKEGGKTTVLGTTPTLSFKPQDHLTSSCGSTDFQLKLTATDKDGSASDHVDESVLWGAC